MEAKLFFIKAKVWKFVSGLYNRLTSPGDWSVKVIDCLFRDVQRMLLFFYFKTDMDLADSTAIAGRILRIKHTEGSLSHKEFTLKSQSNEWMKKNNIAFY